MQSRGTFTYYYGIQKQHSSQETIVFYLTEPLIRNDQNTWNELNDANEFFCFIFIASWLMYSSSCWLDEVNIVLGQVSHFY